MAGIYRTFSAGGQLSRTQAGGLVLPTIPGGDLPPSKRYYRIQAIASAGLTADTLDLTEVEFYDSETKLTGITVTASYSGSVGPISRLVDGDTSLSSRVYRPGWSGVESDAYIQFDFGSAKVVSKIKVFQSYGPGRFPSSFELWSSDSESSGYSLATTCSGYSFTDLGGNLSESGDILTVTPDTPNLTFSAADGTVGVWRDNAYIYKANATAPGWKLITTA
jgi:hypothetical protein